MGGEGGNTPPSACLPSVSSPGGVRRARLLSLLPLSIFFLPVRSAYTTARQRARGARAGGGALARAASQL